MKARKGKLDLAPEALPMVSFDILCPPNPPCVPLPRTQKTQSCQAALPVTLTLEVRDFLFARRGSHWAQVRKWCLKTESSRKMEPTP